MTPRARKTLWGIARALLFVLGVWYVGSLISSYGARKVADILLGAGPWLPLIVLLETTFLITDTLAVRSLLGEKASDAPASAWARSAMQAYALMTLLPAGRAAGEVARVAAISPYIDKGRAALATTRMTAGYMLAIAVVSASAALFAIRVGGFFSSVTGLAAFNVLATGSLGTLLVIIPRSARLKGLVRRFFPRFADGPYRDLLDDDVRPPVPYKAGIICFAARCAQALQYGIVLVAVGGTATVSRAVLTLGLSLFGATVGGAVPSQAGVNEGIYKTFADWMGLGDAPEKAISVALVVRMAQLALALVCLVGASLLAPKAPPKVASVQS